FAVDRSRRADARRADEPGKHPALVFGKPRSRPLFGQRLPKVLRRQADFFSELDQLVFGEFFAGIGVGRLSLKLGGASQHALERATIDAAGRSGCGYVGHAESYRAFETMIQLYCPACLPVSSRPPRCDRPRFAEAIGRDSLAQIPPSTTSICRAIASTIGCGSGKVLAKLAVGSPATLATPAVPR